MSTVKFRLEDLPDNVRTQAAAKLAADGPRSAPKAPEATSVPKTRKTRTRALSAPDAWLGASKTEQRFYQTFFANAFRFSDVYETVRLRIAPGTFYTPDFVYQKQDGGVCAIEVKGSFRLGSASRAYTAFMCARDKFPWIEFQWWEERKDGFVRKH